MERGLSEGATRMPSSNMTPEPGFIRKFPADSKSISRIRYISLVQRGRIQILDSELEAEPKDGAHGCAFCSYLPAYLENG
jgi:hypothetical protein